MNENIILSSGENRMIECDGKYHLEICLYGWQLPTIINVGDNAKEAEKLFWHYAIGEVERTTAPSTAHGELAQALLF